VAPQKTATPRDAPSWEAPHKRDGQIRDGQIRDGQIEGVSDEVADRVPSLRPRARPSNAARRRIPARGGEKPDEAIREPTWVDDAIKLPTWID
jgi:hypothetical protein